MPKFGKLPHRPFRPDTPMHIVYRLKDSLPMPVVKRLKQQRIDLYRENVGGRDKANEAFEQLLEHSLHFESNGPYHLAKPELARLVLDSWKWIAKNKDVYVYAICIMSNHVHVLARGTAEHDLPAGKVMHSHKSFTALECNRLLGIEGKSFWAISYFDRDLREGTFDRVMWYILNNPVKAGLVEHWEEWPHTYLNPDFDAVFRRGGGAGGPR